MDYDSKDGYNILTKTGSYLYREAEGCVRKDKDTDNDWKRTIAIALFRDYTIDIDDDHHDDDEANLIYLVATSYAIRNFIQLYGFILSSGFRCKRHM